MSRGWQQRSSSLSVERMKRDEVLRDVFVVGDVFVAGDAAEDLGKLFLGDGAQLDLGLDAAQECGIDQAGGIVIRGEDDQHFEGNLDLFAADQGQEIDAAVEGHDPAVEQLVGAQALAAEVVDDEHAVVGLHLHRADVELRRWGCTACRAFRR